MATPYHLLLGRRDWEPLVESRGEEVAWDGERHRLTLAPELLRFPARGSERVLTPEDRRGSGADRFGHIYWIDESAAAVRYRPAGTLESAELWSVADLEDDCDESRGGAFTPVPAPAPPTPPRLRGLAATCRGYLVVGMLAPGGLLVFDLHGGGPPVWHRWPPAVSFAPFDMAAAPDGGVWILDRPDGADPRLWYLDCALRVGSPPGGPRVELEPAATDEFRDVGGEPRVKPAATFPGALPLTLSVPAAETTPVGLTTLPDGSLLVLDQGPFGDDALIHRLDCGMPAGHAVALAGLLQALLPGEPGFTGHDLAFLSDEGGAATPGGVAGTLYVAAAEGNQSFAFRLAIDGDKMSLDATTRYLPMRRYAGKALVAAPDAVFYDQQDIWLALTELPRPRYAESGRLSGIVFDGKEPLCTWHRLFLDACIPPGDAVVIESRAADDESELERTPWHREQPPYLREINRRDLASGDSDRPLVIDESERPYHRPFGSASLSHRGVGTWELLFQRAVGRFLELRLTLRGSGRSSPKIQALRAYYPRLSYPRRFLPAVYREEPVSASFLERFLANFEGFYSEVEERVAAVQTLFDSRTAPPEALDWLAGWLGAALEEDWEESRRRLFVRHAIELYRQRGTPRGLARAIRLAIEPCPDERLFDASLDYAPFGVRIVERFASRLLPTGQLESTGGGVLPSQVSAAAPWDPSQGGARLHRLWRQYLTESHVPSGDSQELVEALGGAWETAPKSLGAIRFTPLPPADAVAAADRLAFIDQRLGMPYAELGPGDVGLYRSFLDRRWGSIGALNEAYGLTGAGEYGGFDEIELPVDNRLPADGAPLEDWFQFATVDVAAARAAHRFSVLVPVTPEQGPAERQRLLERVAAVVERERPSHTEFDVQLYWALFRVGAARAGYDTVLGEGSRFTSLILDAGYVGEGLLEEAHPWNVTDRWVSSRAGVGAEAIG